MGWLRWWLARLLMGSGAWNDVEAILRADACSECGSWRCLSCQNLILGAADHAPDCRLYQSWH